MLLALRSSLVVTARAKRDVAPGNNQLSVRRILVEGAERQRCIGAVTVLERRGSTLVKVGPWRAIVPKASTPG